MLGTKEFFGSGYFLKRSGPKPRSVASAPASAIWSLMTDLTVGFDGLDEALRVLFDEFFFERDEVLPREFLAVVLAGLQQRLDGVERCPGEGGGVLSAACWDDQRKASRLFFRNIPDIRRIMAGWPVFRPAIAP
jgi:hypothetical protein